MRALGVSFWGRISYTEAELLIAEILCDPNSRLTKAVAELAPSQSGDPERQKAEAETADAYRKRYGIGSVEGQGDIARV